MYRKPNFEEYTYEELVEAKSHIDKEQYPERYAEISALINKPNHKPKEKKEEYRETVSDSYSTFTYRCLAILIDCMVLGLFSYPIEMLFTIDEASTELFYNFIKAFVFFSYFIFMHGFFDGQTVGKMLLKIKVVNYFNENEISLYQAFIRESLYIIISSIFLILNIISLLLENNSSLFSDSVLMVFFTAVLIFYCMNIVITLLNDKRRSIHDYLASTVVIRTSKETS